MDAAVRGTARAERGLAAGQAALYVATGVWPLVHMPSFEAVTGPKRERWLVRTVGVLVTVVGAVLAAGAARRRTSPELRLLGAATATALAGVDVWYAGVRRRISPVYLADAVVELALAAAWAACALERRAGRGAR
jgi:hypothetical protein